jgi:poly-gamma-glutamate synthesis protein (capsule biosynthesis protein)
MTLTRSPGEVRIVAVGDVQPNRADPTSLFARIRPYLEWGDLRYCQLECTISDKGILRTDVRNPAHRVSPQNIEALTSAGFNIVSFAGNNNLDYGIEAFRDTLERLTAHGISYVGAGENLVQARSSTLTTIRDTRIAWVNFCSILRDGFEAGPERPGISPLKVSTFYEPLENIYEQPGTPAKTVTVPDPLDFSAAMETIRSVRSEADVVIGCFHWGVHFTYDLASYQADIAYAAIENGCDLILGTHPHCLQAIDIYRDKHIFYSLGNFAFEQPESFARVGVAKYLTFYDLQPGTGIHPHPEHCKRSILVNILIQEKQITDVSFLPVYFADNDGPVLQEQESPVYNEIAELLKRLCAEIGTELTHSPSGLRVVEPSQRQVDARSFLANRKRSYPWLEELAGSGKRR